MTIVTAMALEILATNVPDLMIPWIRITTASRMDVILYPEMALRPLFWIRLADLWAPIA